jgi:hypothetical protein
MTIKELFKLKLGDALSVSKVPFTYVGHAQIELDGGAKLRWLYDDEGNLFSISPKDEEMVFLREIGDDVDPDGDTVVFKEKEYEFNSEETGTVMDTHGESVAETDETLLVSDYQTAEGEILRVVNNEATGENLVYLGKYVSEDDVAEL